MIFIRRGILFWAIRIITLLSKKWMAALFLHAAEEMNCYKMMLLSGAKDKETLDFYRQTGYNSEDKTAFIQWIGR